MPLSRSDFEIMAPVGSFESLAAALDAGADAVYFGVEHLNMRSRSSHNFSLDDLRTIVSTCRARGVKTYLTLNIILYAADLAPMRVTVDAARAAGVSAVIASDMAVILYCRSVGVEVHLSTQLNISNVDALRFYAGFAEVAVLARELDLEQVAAIHRAIESEPILSPSGRPVRIEMFCHGALCMAVSGKCYLSLHHYNASANRGACMQLCRHGYTVRERDGEYELDIDEQYIMSPKDLKTLHFLNKMVDAGVRVFKIEGRARSADYVRATVECYDQALRAVLSDTFTPDKIAAWDARLARVFNRGFWDGYYLGQRLGEWTSVYGSAATHKKVYVGRGVKYFSRIGVAEFRLETSDLTLGDSLLVTGPSTGAQEFTLTAMEIEGRPVSFAPKGQNVAIKTDFKVRPSDKLYKWLPTAEVTDGQHD